MTASRHRQFRMGDPLITEGVESRVAYLILDGEVEVRVGTRTSAPKSVARLGKGEVIGELSMLDDDLPTASVIACGDVKVSIPDPEGVPGTSGRSGPSHGKGF